MTEPTIEELTAKLESDEGYARTLDAMAAVESGECTSIDDLARRLDVPVWFVTLCCAEDNIEARFGAPVTSTEVRAT